MEELDTARIYRNLESKLKIGGFESLDLILALFSSGIMNLIFGGSDIAFYFVSIPPILILGIAWFGKRNRPEGFLRDAIRYYFLPHYLSAGKKSENHKFRRRKIYEGNKSCG